jgi:Xaa-Pro dipeptidase
MILFDYARASRLMQNIGVDIIVAHTRPNVGYLADYWTGWITTPYLVAEDGAEYQIFAGLPADQDISAFITCKTGGEEQQMFHEHVWIEDKRIWGPTNTAREAASPWGHENIYKDPFKGVEIALRDRGLENSRIGVEQKYLGVEPFERMKQLLPGVTFVNAQSILTELRMIKTEEEIERMRVIADVTTKVLMATFNALRVGSTTFDIEKLLIQNYAEEGILRDWAQISIGPTGAENMQSAQAVVKQGEIIRIDTGARYKGYFNDISKVAVIGRPGHEVKRAYNAARAVVDVVCDTIKPGVRGADVYKSAVDVLAGFGYDMFCPVICHGIGRVVHEPPHLTADSEALLEKGMVMAIEMPLVIRGLGIMALEDMIMVTEDGCSDISTTGRELLII